MANISDVYSIEFEASTEELAGALHAYIKATDTPQAYYNTASDLTREGKILSGGFASGRWVYSTNLEGTFERPEEWHGPEYPKKEWEAVLKLLKAGETIKVSYSEDEPGCVVHQDGYGTVGYSKESGSVYVSLEFEDHVAPCDIVDSSEATGETEDKPFYCYAHEELTDNEEQCERAVALVS